MNSSIMDLEDLEKKVLKTIGQFDMLAENATVVVGASGGADSMALLYFLLKSSGIKNIKVIAAHVNHCLRGTESDRDENFVRSFCEVNNVELKILKMDISKKAKEMKMGLEECGRLVRYEFFESLAEQNKAKVALAHTLSDNVETIIFNLARGSGIHGLCGIAPVRDNIIRPLIFLEKSEILDYCNTNKIKYVEDSSNKDRRYSRNKIRLGIVPILKEINPNLERAFFKVSTLLQSDNNCLNNIAKNELSNMKIKKNQYCLEKLKKLNPAIKSRCIRFAVLDVNENVNLNFSHVNLVLDIVEKGFGTVSLPKQLYVKAEKGVLKIFLHPDFFLEEEKRVSETDLCSDPSEGLKLASSRLTSGISLKGNAVEDVGERFESLSPDPFVPEQNLRVHFKPETNSQSECLIPTENIRMRNICLDPLPQKEAEYESCQNNSLTETGRGFIIRIVSKKQYDDLLNKDKTISMRSVDYDKLPRCATLRNRRPGDTFYLQKRGITKPLKKLFNEEKIPIEERNELFMIADKTNILWLEGFGTTEFLKVDNSTKKVLIIDIGRN